MTKSLISCKTCGASMASNAKSCPACGAKNKRPLYKKWWFYVLLFLVVVGIASGMGGANGNTEKTPSAETKHTVEAEKKENLEIIEGPEIEQDSFSSYFVGVVKNNTDKEYSYVSITFNLYDAQGNLLGTAIDNVNNLKGGGTWKFKAVSFVSEEFASWELDEVSGF